MTFSAEVPAGWRATTLGEQFRWGSGGTPKRTESSYYGGGIPWAVIGDLNDGVVTTTRDSLTQAGVDNSAAKWISPGAVLVAMYGSIGKLGIAGVPMTCNQAIAFADPDGVPSKYLFYYLKHVRRHLISAGKGGTQRNISQEVLKRVPFLLAPSTEQEALAAKLDELFSDLDAGVAALERAKANLARYRAAVLKAVVEGKLTEQWRREHPLPDVEASATTPHDSDLPPLPSSWKYVSLDCLLAEELANGRSVRTASEGFPILRLTALKDGWIDLGEFKIGEWTRSQAARFLVQADDVFVARGNGSRRLVGRAGLVSHLEDEIAFPDTMIRVRLSHLFVPSLFVAVWNSQSTRRQLEPKAKTSAGIYKVNQRDLHSILLPLPPLAEQHEILRQLEHLESQITAAFNLIEASCKRALGLRAGILRRAFEGALVESVHLSANEDKP